MSDLDKIQEDITMLRLGIERFNEKVMQYSGEQLLDVERAHHWLATLQQISSSMLMFVIDLEGRFEKLKYKNSVERN